MNPKTFAFQLKFDIKFLDYNCKQITATKIPIKIVNVHINMWY